METFSSKLLSFPKRHEKEFTKEQLVKHLAEVLHLHLSHDPHEYAEIIDLINIAQLYLGQNLSTEEIDDLTQKRFDKFMSKLQQDEKNS